MQTQENAEITTPGVVPRPMCSVILFCTSRCSLDPFHAIAGCVTHQPNPIPGDFWAIWVPLALYEQCVTLAFSPPPFLHGFAIFTCGGGLIITLRAAQLPLPTKDLHFIWSILGDVSWPVSTAFQIMQ